MILSDVFQRFVEDSPASVMAQALLENALPPSVVDTLYEEHAQLQCTRIMPGHSKSIRTAKLDLRFSPKAKQKLQAAASLARRSVGEFVLESALVRA